MYSIYFKWSIAHGTVVTAGRKKWRGGGEDIPQFSRKKKRKQKNVKRNQGDGKRGGNYLGYRGCHRLLRLSRGGEGGGGVLILPGMHDWWGPMSGLEIDSSYMWFTGHYKRFRKSFTEKATSLAKDRATPVEINYTVPVSTLFKI
jgi:hypothetical protein